MKPLNEQGASNALPVYLQILNYLYATQIQVLHYENV